MQQAAFFQWCINITPGISWRIGRGEVVRVLALQFKGIWFDPQLLQSFGWDYKPRSRLHDLVISGLLNPKHHRSHDILLINILFLRLTDLSYLI